MNDTIVKNHNERVKKDDITYFIGDFAFYASKYKEFRGEGMKYDPDELLKTMNGKFEFIDGNHDKESNKVCNKIHKMILHLGGMFIELIHNPKHCTIEDENIYYPLHLCGHVHHHYFTKEIVNANGKPAFVINVGVDLHNFYPWGFQELLRIYFHWQKNHKQRKDINLWIKQSRDKLRALSSRT